MLVSVYSGLNLGLYGLQLMNLTFSSCHKSLLLETLINLTPGSLPLGSSFRFNHVSHSPPIVHHVLPSLADDCGKMKETRWRGDLSHALRDLKGDHFSPKSDISPQKCSLLPRKDHSTTSI